MHVFMFSDKDEFCLHFSAITIFSRWTDYMYYFMTPEQLKNID